MLNSGFLGLVIGLILIFFLLSLICSGISEVLEAMIHRRSKFLEAGVVDILGPALKGQLYSHPLIRGLHSPKGPPKTEAPAIGHTSPSYIPSRVFAQAMLSILSDATTTLTEPVDEHAAGAPVELHVASTEGFPSGPGFKLRVDTELLRVTGLLPGGWSAVTDEGSTPVPHAAGAMVSRVRPSGTEAAAVIASVEADVQRLPDSQIKTAMANFLQSAAGDLAKWQGDVEKWFDDKMARVSGWYKRRTKVILFAIGLIVAIALNADTVVFARTLWSDSTLRSAVTNAANDIVKSGQSVCPSPSPGEPSPSSSPDELACVSDRVSQLQGLKLPLGWPTAYISRWKTEHGTDSRVPHNALEAWLKVAGLLLTGLALSLGAPFWFDLLNKFVNVRATGAPPQQSTDATQKTTTVTTGAGG